MGIFFLTKLTKIPIYRLEKKAARLVRAELKMFRQFVLPYTPTPAPKRVGTYRNSSTGKNVFTYAKLADWKGSLVVREHTISW